MSNRDPDATYNDPVQAIEFALREWVRANLRTAMPGIVRAYDARLMRARVVPALRNIVAQDDGSDEPMDQAPLYDVPVIWPGGGGVLFHTDLNAGDTVWMMVSERGIGTFKRTLEMSNPPPMVMFEAKDAVAIPWAAQPITVVNGTTGGNILDIVPTAPDGPITSATGATLQTRDGTTHIQMTDDGIVLQVGSVTMTLSGTGVAIAGGVVSHNGTNIGDTHRHGGVQSGGSLTLTPQ